MSSNEQKTREQLVADVEAYTKHYYEKCEEVNRLKQEAAQAIELSTQLDNERNARLRLASSLLSKIDTETEVLTLRQATITSERDNLQQQLARLQEEEKKNAETISSTRSLRRKALADSHELTTALVLDEAFSRVRAKARMACESPHSMDVHKQLPPRGGDNVTAVVEV